MYCNICGKWYTSLERHHILKNRTKTEKIILICKKCHIRLHIKNNDFAYWGKIGFLKRKKKENFNASYIARGIKNWQK